jgi:hypothetical protein
MNICNICKIITNMHKNAIYAIKSRAQGLTFPKHSNISAASSMELILDVHGEVRIYLCCRPRNATCLSLNWSSSRLSATSLARNRIGVRPHISVYVPHHLFDIRPSSRLAAACIVLRMSACRPGREAGAGGGRAADPGPAPAWESSPGAWSSLSNAGFMGSSSESELERRQTATKLL